MISSISSSDTSYSLSLSNLQEKIFLKADKNGDGKIDSSEMSAMQASAPQGGSSFEDMLTKLDTDQDGSVSRAESDAAIMKMFYEMSQDGSGLTSSTSATSSTTSSQASQGLTDLFSKLDTSSSGTLTESQVVSSTTTDATTSRSSSSTDVTANSELLQAFLTAINNYVSTMEQGASSSSDTSTSTTASSSSSNASQRATEVFSKIDTNGDGSVSKDEFVSGRPDQISKDQATQMWSQLDTSGSGSLTQSQFVSAMASQPPLPEPPPGGFGNGEETSLASSASASSASSSSTSSTSTANSELVQALMTAISKYISTMEQSSSSSATLSTAASSLSVAA